MELDYEKDMKIDPDSLDIEWLEQASLGLRYGKEFLRLKKEVDVLAERKKIIRSELIQEANNDPEGCCGKAKPNASDIEAYYRTNKRYKEIVEELQEAEYEAAYAEIAKNQIDFARKVALENLVTLHGQQYFAGPRVPRNISEEWEKKKKQQTSNTTVSAGMKRKRVREEDDK